MKFCDANKDGKCTFDEFNDAVDAMDIVDIYNYYVDPFVYDDAMWIY